nr:hypothetical protein CFP56_06390 [Quercus suber]
MLLSSLSGRHLAIYVMTVNFNPWYFFSLSNENNLYIPKATYLLLDRWNRLRCLTSANEYYFMYFLLGGCRSEEKVVVRTVFRSLFKT